MKTYEAEKQALIKARNKWLGIPEPPDWQHRSLLPESEATAWYETCSVLPQWTDCGDGPGDFDRKAINFGTAYGHDGLKNSDGVEYPIEDWMYPLVESVCKCPDVMAPCNYVQCHWIGKLGCVLPHKDPGGMHIPMLTLGHARVFRVGGKMPQGYFRWTTPAMREFGPGDAARKAGHDQQSKAAIENYRNGLTDFLGREVKS